MKLKIFTLVIISAFVASGLASCGGTKKSESEYVGKTYSNSNELGLYPGTGVMLTNNISLNIFSIDPNDYSTKNTHILLAEHNADNSVITILAEMDIDRETSDKYIYHEVNYTHNGEYRHGEHLLRMDPDGNIKEFYIIDLDKLKFIPKEPYENMELEEYGW